MAATNLVKQIISEHTLLQDLMKNAAPNAKVLLIGDICACFIAGLYDMAAKLQESRSLNIAIIYDKNYLLDLRDQVLKIQEAAQMPETANIFEWVVLCSELKINIAAKKFDKFLETEKYRVELHPKPSIVMQFSPAFKFLCISITDKLTDFTYNIICQEEKIGISTIIAELYLSIDLCNYVCNEICFDLDEETDSEESDFQMFCNDYFKLKQTEILHFDRQFVKKLILTPSSRYELCEYIYNLVIPLRTTTVKFDYQLILEILFNYVLENELVPATFIELAKFACSQITQHDDVTKFIAEYFVNNAVLEFADSADSSIPAESQHHNLQLIIAFMVGNVELAKQLLTPELEKSIIPFLLNRSSVTGEKAKQSNVCNFISLGVLKLLTPATYVTQLIARNYALAIDNKSMSIEEIGKLNSDMIVYFTDNKIGLDNQVIYSYESFTKFMFLTKMYKLYDLDQIWRNMFIQLVADSLKAAAPNKYKFIKSYMWAELSDVEKIKMVDIVVDLYLSGDISTLVFKQVYSLVKQLREITIPELPEFLHFSKYLARLWNVDRYDVDKPDKFNFLTDKVEANSESQPEEEFEQPRVYEVYESYGDNIDHIKSYIDVCFDIWKDNEEVKSFMRLDIKFGLHQFIGYLIEKIVKNIDQQYNNPINEYDFKNRILHVENYLNNRLEVTQNLLNGASPEIIQNEFEKYINKITIMKIYVTSCDAVQKLIENL